MGHIKPSWLSRELITNPFCYCLCLNEKEFHKKLRWLKLPRADWPPFLRSTHANATAHFFETGEGDLAAILCLGDTKNVGAIQIAALLVHEAVHIWQRAMADIGETAPSDEFMAYGIQRLSQELMYSYAEQTK